MDAKRKLDPATSLAQTVLASADRIEALSRDASLRAPEIRHELEQLRRAARASSS